LLHPKKKFPDVTIPATAAYDIVTHGRAGGGRLKISDTPGGSAILTRAVSDETQLLERIRGGATDEFAEIVRRHQSRVFAVLSRYERDAQRLEDLAQETFVKAWRALEQFDGRAPFEHWISRIAVRAALDHLRKRQRVRNEVGFDEIGEDALDWLQSGDDARELESSQAREILDAAMRELSPADQMVITLQEIEGRSVKEIAGLMGISGVAVRVRALRARAKLKTALEKIKRDKKI
jgi:RNA polymerase sigma-70 factor (ECF subfamily)